MNSLSLAASDASENMIYDKEELSVEGVENNISKIEHEMLEAAKNLEFEKAAKLRDKLNRLKEDLLIIS